MIRIHSRENNATTATTAIRMQTLRPCSFKGNCGLDPPEQTVRPMQFIIDLLHRPFFTPTLDRPVRQVFAEQLPRLSCPFRYTLTPWWFPFSSTL